MRILITGSSGILGKYLLDYLKDAALFDTDLLDFKKTQSVIKNVDSQVLIHLASQGNIDYCQKNKNAAYKTNVEASINLHQNIKKNCKFIFISSSNVYDGKLKSYSEDSPRNPINFYGETKKAFEDYLIQNSQNFAILRLTNLYGIPPKNYRNSFITSLFSASENNATMTSSPLSRARFPFLKKDDISGSIHPQANARGFLETAINAVNDRFTNFLYAKDAANLIKEVAKMKNGNVVINFGGTEVLSFYNFAKKLTKSLDHKKIMIKPVKSEDFKNIAPRPQMLNLSNKRAFTLLKVKPLGFYDAMADIKKGLQKH